MLNLVSFNAAFGLANIQEEYVATTKKTFKLVGGDIMTLLLPNNTPHVSSSNKRGLNGTNLLYRQGKYSQLGWMKSIKKDCVTIVMKIGTPIIFAKVLRYTYYKEWMNM